MNGLEVDRNFGRNFLISLGIHGGLLALAFIGGKFIGEVFKNNDIEIIRAAVRVDVVGMPKFTVEELRELQRNAAPAEPEVAKGPKEETKPKEEDTPDVIKKDDLVIPEAGKEKKKSSFLNIVSDYSAKKLDKVAREKGEKQGTSNKNLESLVIEGNKLSRGSALVGDFSDEMNSEFASYVQALPDSIRQFWKLPTHLLEKDLRCRIRIYLSSTGQLLKLEIHESSGDPEFDTRAERAVREAAPFPKPTDTVATRLTSSGIILGFPL